MMLESRRLAKPSSAQVSIRSDPLHIETFVWNRMASEIDRMLRQTV
jgi:hypothetical protein